MGCFKFKRALFGLVTVCAAASLFAEDALLDNNDDGTNENEFEYYWYYYDDNTGCGKDDRSVRAPDDAKADASTIQCSKVKENVERHFEGNADDKYMIKQYTFECGEDPTTKNRYATMPFKLGKGWKVEYPTYSYTAAPYVGLGTMLCGDGKSLDLSKATGFKFDIRSHVTTDLVVKFKVQQLDIEKDSTFGYYEYTIADVGPEWKTKTVLFTDLAQPDWATDERERDWTPDALTKLGWHIELADGELVDTLDVDNVYVLDYTFVSPKMWTETAEMGIGYKDTVGVFEKADNRAYSKLVKQYWYAYNDCEIKGESKVDEEYAKQDETTKRLTLQWKDGTGANEKGYGAALKYTLGPAVMQHDTVKVKGFVGIGVNLYDSAKSEYFNAEEKGIKAVYFNYMTDGDLAYATMEVSDVNDVPDAENPTRKDSRGSGIVHFRNIPNTKGQWRAVEIPFDKLVEMTDWQGYKEIPLDLTKLAKLQFKVQGAENAGGFLFIDNVMFSDGKTSVRNINSRSVVSPFTASYRNGKLNINWTGKTAIAEGKISLIDAKGCVVQSSSIAKASKVSDRISVSNLASGVYMVKLIGKDVNGKTVSMQSSVNLIK
ncbi:MAG TPA: carbohydrate binding domain-containing protein [Chitinispirillaceae bacterium]|nr:carbohydrate binding domain-containing protein [Chitinispirillaceae bacterium]